MNSDDDESLYESSSDSEEEMTKSKPIHSGPTIEDEDDEDSVDIPDSVESEDEEENIGSEIDDDEEDIQDGGADSELEEGEIVEEDEDEDDETTAKQVKPTKAKINIQPIEDDDDDDEYDENYLQKFDSEITRNYISDFHPECFNHNYEEIEKLSTIVRNSDNIIIDPLHKTIPFLTKYEKTRILGQRAKQIEMGARPFISVDEKIIDSYIIAELELREKKIPFIIKRPIPNGGFEYWHVKDLEIIY
jgi:DNA-directed RNA polymerase I, II, and III subunit RPABC2